mmetsp:Transcript_21566/g.32781  ORF Transcript_21566/g.32781 Transcript_21566/m.32781 type:complete len:211 (-) Transcript_21566:499-1131(-)
MEPFACEISSQLASLLPHRGRIDGFGVCPRPSSVRSHGSRRGGLRIRIASPFDGTTVAHSHLHLPIRSLCDEGHPQGQGQDRKGLDDGRCVVSKCHFQNSPGIGGHRLGDMLVVHSHGSTTTTTTTTPRRSSSSRWTEHEHEQDRDTERTGCARPRREHRGGVSGIPDRSPRCTGGGGQAGGIPIAAQAPAPVGIPRRRQAKDGSRPVEQ